MTRHIESRLQQQCVAWFRLQHRSLAPLLFAVPNGGARRLREAQIMKAEGVTAGGSQSRRYSVKTASYPYGGSARTTP